MKQFEPESHPLFSPRREKLIASKLAEQLPQIFGYHSLLYTPLAAKLCGSHIVIKQQVVVGERGEGLSLKCRFEELPVASDTIDLAVLPGILEQTNNPHQVLREVERVLIPEGRVIVIGRNPLSWLGVKHKFQAWRKREPATLKDISRWRINDWFRLLGFETELEVSISLSNERLKKSNGYPWLKKLGQTFCDYFCSYYIITARKKVSTLTPIRPSWRRNKQLVPSRLAEPGVTNQVENWFEKLK